MRVPEYPVVVCGDATYGGLVPAEFLPGTERYADALRCKDVCIAGTLLSEMPRQVDYNIVQAIYRVKNGLPPRALTCTERNRLPVLYQGHFSNLLGEIIYKKPFRRIHGHAIEGARLWYSRMSCADGATCVHQRELEVMCDGCWYLIEPDDYTPDSWKQ